VNELKSNGSVIPAAPPSSPIKSSKGITVSEVTNKEKKLGETKIVTKRLVRRRRVGQAPAEQGPAEVTSSGNSGTEDSPDLLLKDAVSSIEKMLEETNANLGKGATKPIRIKRKMT
jgi:hypothetical protein